MENVSTPKKHKSATFYMRMIHRVLGYFTLGLVVIYALSGITLIHRTGNFMKKGTPVETVLAPGLTADELGSALKMKYFKPTDETDNTIYFADGQYDKATGKASYIKREVVAPMNKFIDLHKISDGKDRLIGAITTIFGIALFLLALTSLFMYPVKSKQFKANMIYTSIGVMLAIVLVICV